MQELARDNCTEMLSFIESFEDDKSFYVVVKYMPAGDLLNYVCNQPTQPLDEEHTKMIIRQVAQGLKAMHSRLIIHRDIKLENLLVTSNSRDA